MFTDRANQILKDMPAYVKSYIRATHNRTAPRTSASCPINGCQIVIPAACGSASEENFDETCHVRGGMVFLQCFLEYRRQAD